MFLQVITRTFEKRPRMLARNQESLARLTDTDWEQTLVVDSAARGCAWANANLATVPATGEWVWVLDDDDLCVLPSLVELLKRLSVDRDAGVVAVRAIHVDYGVLPHDEHWGKRPHLTDCGYSNFICRGAVWEQYRRRFEMLDCYAADYEFYSYLWDQGVRFHWHDVVVAHYPRRSAGRPE